MLIQQKGNQWPPSCFFWSYPASVYPVKNPSAPACQSPKKKKKLGVEETRRGVMRQSELRPPRRGSRRETVTQIKKKKISHFHCQFSSKNTRTRLTSPPLWSQGAMQIHKPLHFFSPPLCFPSTPLRQSRRPPRPIVLNTSSPSLVDYMTEPRLPSCCSYSLRGWGGGGRNDKSYLQVTVGNSEIQDVEKFKLFCSFSFFLSFSLSPCFL